MGRSGRRHWRPAVTAGLIAFFGTLSPVSASDPVNLRIGWAQVGHVTPLLDVLVKRHPELFPHFGKSYVAQGVRFNGSTPQIEALAVSELEVAANAIDSSSDDAMRMMLRKHGVEDVGFATVETNFATTVPVIAEGKVDHIAVRSPMRSGMDKAP